MKLPLLKRIFKLFLELISEIEVNYLHILIGNKFSFFENGLILGRSESPWELSGNKQVGWYTFLPHLFFCIWSIVQSCSCEAESLVALLYMWFFLKIYFIFSFISLFTQTVNMVQILKGTIDKW